MQSKIAKNISLFIIVVAFISFIYVTVKSIEIANRTQISTNDGIYSNHVKTSQEIHGKALILVETCESELCKVQNILDYVTHIPYKINHFKAHSPQKTIQNNYGDCDDKSNLLISMLHALDIEAYFVLVPKHIFVIVPLVDKRLSQQKGLWLDEKKYFILESTAKGSSIGYPLQYELSQINTIVDPFSNQKMRYERLEYKL